MALVNRVKWGAYHLETKGCGFVRGVSGTPIHEMIPSITRAWFDIGSSIVS